MKIRRSSIQQDDMKNAWQEYGRNRDPLTRKAMIEHYLPVVRAVAERMQAKLPGNVEIDDMISSGTFGLMDAVNSYDPQRGIKFETYCVPRIRGAMLDELRSMDWVPRLTRSRHRKVTDAIGSLEADAGQTPTERELAARLGVSNEIAKRMLSDSHVVGQVSLEHRVMSSGDMECRIAETIEDHREKDPARVAMCRDLKDALVRGLSRSERLVVLLYNCEGMTMREIGQVLSLSESRVSQIHSELMIRLRCMLEKRKTSDDAA